MSREFPFGIQGRLIVMLAMVLTGCGEFGSGTPENRKIDRRAIAVLQDEWIPVQHAILLGRQQEAIEAIDRHPEWLESSRFRNMIVGPALRHNIVPVLERVLAHTETIPDNWGDIASKAKSREALLLLFERGLSKSKNSYLSDAVNQNDFELLESLLNLGVTSGATVALTQINSAIDDDAKAEVWIRRLAKSGGAPHAALKTAVERQSLRRVKTLIEFASTNGWQENFRFSIDVTLRSRFSRELRESGRVSQDTYAISELIFPPYRGQLLKK